MRDNVSQPYAGGKNGNPIIPSWAANDECLRKDDPLCICGHEKSAHEIHLNSLISYECDYSNSKIINCSCKKFEEKKP